MKILNLITEKKFITLLIILIVSIGFAQTTRTYTTSGNFISPAGVNTIQVEAYGAGGGGGFGGSGNRNGGGGGGGGGYSRNNSVSVTSGTNYSITIGNPGIGSISSTTPNGTNGGNTFATFGATTVNANGGNGGFGYTNGGAGGIGGFGSTYIGGNGGDALNGIGSGGGGGGAGPTSNGGLGNVPNGGNSGGGFAGVGGNGSTLVAANGSNASNYGAGGGGGTKSSSGGNGTAGYLIITYTCPTYALTASTTSNGPLCNASPSVITLRSSSLATGTYTVTYNLSGATSVVGATATMNFTAGSPGTGTFITSTLNLGTTNVTITNLTSSYCSNSISAFNAVAIVVNSPSTSTAGTNITTCYTSGSINITAGATATNYNLVTWTSNGSGTFTNPNSLTTCTYTPSAGDIAAGNVILTLTASNPGCPNATSTKTLTLISPPTANAGTTIVTCANSAAVNITTGASAANFSSVLWTSSGTGTFSNSNSLTNCFYNPSTSDKSAGSVTLTLTVYGIVPCGNTTSSKILIINTPPTANSGSAVSMCSTDNSVNITTDSNATNYTSVFWSTNGTGTLTNPNSLTNCTYSPSAQDKTNGTVLITLNVVNNGCSNAVSSKLLTIYNIPTSSAGTDIYRCYSSGGINICSDASATNYTSVIWTTNGSGTFTNPNSLTSCTYTPSNADITAGSVVLTLSVNGYSTCSTVSSSKQLFLNRPISVNAGLEMTSCSVSTENQIGLDASANNYDTIIWTTNGTGILNNPNSLTNVSYIPSGSDFTLGQVTFTLTASNLSCGSLSSSKKIAFIEPPFAAAGNNIYTCVNSGEVNISSDASALNYSSISWSTNGTGTLLNPNSLTGCTYLPSNDDYSNGNVTFTLTVYGNPSCNAATSTKNLIFEQSISVFAGSDFSTCYSSGSIDITLDADAQNHSSILWTTNGTGTFINPGSLTSCSYTPSPEDISSGLVMLYLTASNTGCSSETSFKKLVIVPMPIVNAGSTINTCATSAEVNISNGASAFNQTNVIWTTNGTGTFNNPDSLTDCTYLPSSDDIANGSVMLTLTAYGSYPCSSESSTKTLYIHQPAVSSVGADITACYSSGSINISNDASASNYENLIWSSNGTGIFTNATSLSNCSYTPSTADITSGSVIITLTVSNSGCSTNMSSKKLYIIPEPTATAGSTINTCSNSGVVNISSSANATNYTSVLWSSSGSGTFVNSNSLTNCSYIPSDADKTAGSVVLTLTVYGNSPCTTATSSKSLIIFQPATATSGTNILTCYSSGSIDITTGATASNYNTVTWTSNGTGTFLNQNSLTGASYNPSTDDVTSGSVLITLIASNQGCSNATSTKTLTISTQPLANAGTTIVTCSNAIAVNITAGATASNHSSVLWSSSGTGTFTNANSLTNCTYNPSAADKVSGSVTLTLTAFAHSPCSNTTSTKTLIINQPSSANAGANMAVCYSSGSINVTAGSSASNFNIVTWTSSGSGAFTNPNSLTLCSYTPSAADISSGSVTLTLTASNTGCTNAVSTKTLTLSTTPTATAGSTVNMCSNSSSVNITAGANASNYNSINWTSSGSGTFTNANSITGCTYSPSAADISAGSVTLTLTAIGNSPCANATSNKTLIISSQPTAIAGANMTVCYTSGSINISAGANATNHTTVTWSSSGSGSFTNQNSLTACTYTPSAADISAGSVILTLTASNPNCPIATSTKTLSINTQPTAIAGSNINTCSTSGAINITSGSSATNFNSINWSSSGTGSFTNVNSLTACTYNPSASDIAAGSVILTLTATGNAPCANATATKTLIISKPPTAVAGPNFTSCSTNASVNVTGGANATNHTTVLWTSNGTGTFTNPNSLTSCTYTPSDTDITAGSVVLTLTTSNSGCSNAVSSKTLTFVMSPSVQSGSDIATCSTCGTVNITANATASNYTSLLWTSSGTGTFTNATSLTAATYTPSAADMNTGVVTLTLTANGNSPCPAVTSTKVLGITSQTFNSSGTFTVPPGVFQVTVEAWGGGGKGGDGINIGNVGGGGGGGAYSIKSVPVTPGATYSVNVGLGATTSMPGGDSWFINSSTFLAKGGDSAVNNAVTGALGGNPFLCIGDLTTRGGNGANGLSSNYGGGGGAAGEAGENFGVDATNHLGAIAICTGGWGGNGYTSPNGDGNPGIEPGGGGGGGRRNGNNGVNQGTGGKGADGRVIIKWPLNVLIPTVSNGPGGVTSDLQLWLRSDLLNGTTSVADNTPVTTWNTQARGSNAIKPAAVGAPIYRNNPAFNVNFNAVVDFKNPYNSPSQVFTENNATRQYLKGTNGFYSADAFVVVIPNVNVTSSLNSMDVFSGKRTPCAESAKSGISFGNVDARFNNEVLSYTVGDNSAYGTAQVSTTAQYNNVGIINTRNNTANSGIQLFYNGVNIANSEVNNAKHRVIYDSQYWIGRSEGWDGSLDGRIAEIITFSSRKNDATERIKIESYLGIKYGITLGVNGTSQNYLASDGNVIWNASSNTGYNFNIAGIGRDDISKLNQKQSKSVNTNSILTMGLGTIATTNTANTNVFDGDRKYLVWGDNGGNMNNSGTPLTITFGGTSGVTTLTDIPNRKWKVVESGGDVATVKISIPVSALSSLPALSGNDAYVMVKATNDTFTTGVETIFMTVNGSDLETTYDFDGTSFITFGVAHESVFSRHATFDGSSNILKSDAVNDINSAFSMMVWVRPTGQNTAVSDRTIASKFNGTTGYRLYLSTNNKVNISWNGGTTLTSSTILPNNEWHNLAIIYSSGSIKLYIDGVLDSTVNSANPVSNSNIFAIGAEYRSKTDTRNYFKGDIDEFRLWNKALTLSEVRFIMNQEILQNGTSTRGAILPTSITKNDISTLNWNNLISYYSMNTFIGTYINDNSQYRNRSNAFVPTKTTISFQTAPLPYTSTTNGLWSNNTTWENGSVQQIPNSLSLVNGTTPIDWNIVRTAHNIESTGNKTLLGLMVNTNTLSATNDSKIEVSHYLKLDGKIDLVGKSQLIQTDSSDLDLTSSGSIERDQQGQSNKYNYNYWSSPVSTINNTTINHGYTVAGVMKDGTNPNNIQNILWTSGINSSATSPITLSSYWIFKFQNVNNSYANWGSVGQNGILLAGQGYTLKGSSALTTNQNYTFVGKPNNGNITSPIAANNLNLCGNPYASAIDADRFIDDNIGSINGTLFFWEHYSTNTSHATIQYQGGYATYTKVGGTPPVAPEGISGLGTSSKTPKRFIPVGQGFFVTGSNTGGTITFNNAQRLFIKEDNANSYSLYRTSQNSYASVSNEFNNSEDSFETTPFKKLRLGYKSANNYQRQILIGFMNQYATSGIDEGYDGASIESLTNDMYFKNGTVNLNIQGEGYFNPENIYPLGVKNAVEGIVTFKIDGKENFDDNQDIFIHDNVTNIYHSIKSQNFQINLPAGSFENRFSLRFINNSSALNTHENEFIKGITIIHSQFNKTLNIKNQSTDAIIKSVILYNILGQKVTSWNIENQEQNDIKLSLESIKTGTYIVKVITDKGEATKKIAINSISAVLDNEDNIILCNDEGSYSDLNIDFRV